MSCTKNENTNQFTSIPEDDILPKIDKFSLFEQPDSVSKYFKADNIQLRFLPPRHGTVMKLEPYIDDCGIEDQKILDLIYSQKPVNLK